MLKSTEFFGMVQTTDGYFKTDMNVVSMDDVKEANHVTSATMGFKFVWGRTEDGKVYEFYRAGNWAKRDLQAIKDMGVVELVTSWAFAPKHFEIPKLGMVTITKTFELGGVKTAEHATRWGRAMGII